MPAPRGANTPPGPGVDASGQAVIDPTRNVETRVEREIVRVDDMASLRAYYTEVVAAHRAELTEKLAEIRAEYTESMAQLRAEHRDKVEAKESERLNAIRGVDAAAAREQAAAAEARAATLASQVSDAAVVMRTQVDTARIAASESQAVALAPIQAAIESLRQSQYEAQGQKKEVVETQAVGAGRGLWIGLAVTVGVFVAMFLLTLLLGVAGLALTLLLR